MKISKKLLITIICAVVLFCATTSGTIAYIITKSQEAENAFQPVFVSCIVEENFDGVTKSDVKIRNTGDINAYIRATFVVMWVSESGAVNATSPRENTDYAVMMGSSNWVKGSDGFYYYTSPVPPGEATEHLISAIAPTVEGPDGCYLSVHIAATAIQAEPYSAVNEAWGAVVQDGGIITPP